MEAQASNVTSSTNPKVFWKPNEEEVFINRAATILFTGEQKSIQDATRAAQTILPANRRKPLPGLNSAIYQNGGRIINKIKAKVEELKSNYSANQIKAENKLPESAVEVKSTSIEDTPIKEDYQNPVARMQSIARDLAETFRPIIEAAIEEQFNLAFETAMSNLERRLGKKLANRELLRRKVLIVGPLPSQQETIRKEFGDVLDLRFQLTEGNIGQMKQVASTSDFVVLMTDKIGHHHQHAVRLHPGLKMVSGGETGIKNMLMEIYAGQ